MRSKRSHKEIKIDSQSHYGGLAENNPDRKALKKFNQPPAYQAGKLLQEQGKQMESKSLLEYLAERYNIKEVVIPGGRNY